MAMALATLTWSASAPRMDGPRSRRRRTKHDPILHWHSERDVEDWSFSRPPRREFIESGRRSILHAELLKARENEFTATVKIGMAAAKWACENKEEALNKHCVLKAIGDEVNRENGAMVTDGYTEDVVEYAKYIPSPDEDPEEEIDLPGPRTKNSWDWCERADSTEWRKGQPCWRLRMKRKDIIWMRIYDDTQDFRMI